MKKVLLFLLLFWVVACTPQLPQKMGDYNVLTPKSKLKDWVGQKVTFVANRCTFEMQHIVKTMPPTAYLCLDSDATGQILAYYKQESDIRAARLDRFRAFGTLQVMTGAGKGGTTHTEYYLDLDYIDP